MSLLQARGIAKSFGSRLILDGLDFDIEPGVRMGVIGPNGGGKSTLLRILAGRGAADAGEVDAAPRARRRVPAAAARGRRAHALETVRAARPDLDELEHELETRRARSSARSAAISTAWRGCFERQEELLERWTAAGGPGFEGRARALLVDVGLEDDDLGEADARALAAGSASSSGSPRACCAIPTCCCSTSPRRTSTSRRASAWSC